MNPNKTAKHPLPSAAVLPRVATAPFAVAVLVSGVPHVPFGAAPPWGLPGPSAEILAAERLTRWEGTSFNVGSRF